MRETEEMFETRRDAEKSRVGELETEDSCNICYHGDISLLVLSTPLLTGMAVQITV